MHTDIVGIDCNPKVETIGMILACAQRLKMTNNDVIHLAISLLKQQLERGDKAAHYHTPDK